jgi:hypothetical protein
MAPNASRAETLAVANDVVRFALELSVLLIVGYWGYTTGESRLARIGVGVGLPIVIATVWGLFASPKGPYRLDGPPRAVLESAVFGVAILALVGVGRPVLAAAFTVVAGVSIALTHRYENVGRPWETNEGTE